MTYIDKFYRVYLPKYKSSEGRSAAQLQSLNLKDERWDAQNYKITNVKQGTDKNDVAIVDQLLSKNGDVFTQGNNKFEFMESENNNWNAKRRKIEHLNPGTAESDAVTFSQIPTHDQNKWDFKNKIISNAKAGKHSNDCVVKWQTISLDNNKFDGGGKKIFNITPGSEAGEVVVTEQLIKKVGNGAYTLNNENITLMEDNKGVWDGKNKIIKNLKPGTEQSDGACVGQLAHFKGRRLYARYGHVDLLVPNEIGEWDARYGQFANVSEGEKPDHVCLIKQAVLYDNETKNFKHGNKIFDLIDKNKFPNILVADESSPSGFKKLNGSDFTPKYSKIMNTDILVADPNALSGMKKIDGTVYTPKNGVYMHFEQPLHKSWMTDAYGTMLTKGLYTK